MKGTVTVTATATADTGDVMDYISFSDGANYISRTYCEGQPTCTVSVQWQTTGLSGQHTLTATAKPDGGPSATSAAVVVNVVSPPPIVSITSPSAGATLSGTITLSASAATDSALDDYPTRITFYDGVNYLSRSDCQGQTSCDASYSWDATGLTGQHTITAKVDTNREVSATSAGVAVTITSPAPTVRIASPGSGAALGRVVTIRVSGQTDPTQTDYPTRITVSDGSNFIGRIDCQGQQTCSGSLRWDARDLHGRHTLTAEIDTNTERSARSAPVIVGVVSKHNVAVHCTLAATSAKVGQRVNGLCTLPGVAAGTPAAILYTTGSSFRTAVSGAVLSGGRFPFHIHGGAPATVDLWVQVSASATTNAARVKIGTLHIHR